MSPERRARPAECVDNGSHGVVVAIGLRGFQHEQHALGEVAGTRSLHFPCLIHFKEELANGRLRRATSLGVIDRRDICHLIRRF
jgi:hypothetical protein